MFYDKESMLEMFELSINKEKWKHLLITSELFGKESNSLSTKEVTEMHHDWKEAIQAIIHSDDAAYLINQGNIFCLLQDIHIPLLLDKLKDVLLHSSEFDGGLRASALILSNQETEFLLKMS